MGAPILGKDVYLGEGTVVEPGAYIRGPAWIGKNCEIRHGAYLRENVIAGDGCVLGIALSSRTVFFWQVPMPRTSTTWEIPFWGGT